MNDVNVFYGAVAARCERFFERLGGAHMPRPRRCGQQKYARLGTHPRRAPRLADCVEKIIRIPVTKTCDGRRRFFPECRAPPFASRRTASSSPEIRGSAAWLRLDRVVCAISCRALSPDAAAR